MKFPLDTNRFSAGPPKFFCWNLPSIFHITPSPPKNSKCQNVCAHSFYYFPPLTLFFKKKHTRDNETASKHFWSSKMGNTFTTVSEIYQLKPHHKSADLVNTSVGLSSHFLSTKNDLIISHSLTHIKGFYIRAKEIKNKSIRTSPHLRL